MYPTGYKTKVEYIKHPGSVGIVPFFSPRKIVFIRQFRPVVGKYVWEIPAGTLEKNERPLACAKREIKEEIGFSARLWQKIGEIYLACGYSTEKMALYKAAKLSDLGKDKPPQDKDELMEKEILSLSQVKKMLWQKEVFDAKTLAALALLGIGI